MLTRAILRSLCALLVGFLLVSNPTEMTVLLVQIIGGLFVLSGVLAFIGFFAFVAAILLSCNGRSHHPSSPDETNFDAVVWPTDSSNDKLSDSTATGETRPAGKNNRTPATSTSASTQPAASETDNMRGFDPASEDDMDDNGMSRYMENNDDEGWD